MINEQWTREQVWDAVRDGTYVAYRHRAIAIGNTEPYGAGYAWQRPSTEPAEDELVALHAADLSPATGSDPRRALGAASSRRSSASLSLPETLPQSTDRGTLSSSD